MSPRIVLITGANSGVGLATSQVLASTPSPSFHIVIAARSLSKAQTAKSSIESEYPTTKNRLSTIQLDVTDPASIKLAAQTVEQEHGHLDALINNAASGNCDPDVYTRFRACMDTNVIGPAVVSDVFRPLLMKSKDPYSIYVSSGAGSLSRVEERAKSKGEKLPEPENGDAYYVSKAALNMIALKEHMEFGEKGLKVFAMTPGFVVSNLRGPSEEARTGWGKAEDAVVSGETMLSILMGERDADVGKFVHKDGVHGW